MRAQNLLYWLKSLSPDSSKLAENRLVFLELTKLPDQEVEFGEKIKVYREVLEELGKNPDQMNPDVKAFLEQYPSDENIQDFLTNDFTAFSVNFNLDLSEGSDQYTLRASIAAKLQEQVAKKFFPGNEKLQWLLAIDIASSLKTSIHEYYETNKALLAGPDGNLNAQSEKILKETKKLSFRPSETAGLITVTAQDAEGKEIKFENGSPVSLDFNFKSGPKQRYDQFKIAEQAREIDQRREAGVVPAQAAATVAGAAGETAAPDATTEAAPTPPPEPETLKTAEITNEKLEALMKEAGVEKKEGSYFMLTKTNFEGKEKTVTRSFKDGTRWSRGFLEKITGSYKDKETTPKTKLLKTIRMAYAYTLLKLIKTDSSRTDNRHKVGYDELGIARDTTDPKEKERADKLFEASNKILEGIKDDGSGALVAGTAEASPAATTAADAATTAAPGERTTAGPRVTLEAATPRAIVEVRSDLSKNLDATFTKIETEGGISEIDVLWKEDYPTDAKDTITTKADEYIAAIKKVREAHKDDAAFLALLNTTPFNLTHKAEQKGLLQTDYGYPRIAIFYNADAAQIEKTIEGAVTQLKTLLKTQKAAFEALKPTFSEIKDATKISDIRVADEKIIFPPGTDSIITANKENFKTAITALREKHKSDSKFIAALDNTVLLLSIQAGAGKAVGGKYEIEIGSASSQLTKESIAATIETNILDLTHAQEVLSRPEGTPTATGEETDEDDSTDYEALPDRRTGIIFNKFTVKAEDVKEDDEIDREKLIEAIKEGIEKNVTKRLPEGAAERLATAIYEKLKGIPANIAEISFIKEYQDEVIVEMKTSDSSDISVMVINVSGADIQMLRTSRIQADTGAETPGIREGQESIQAAMKAITFDEFTIQKDKVMKDGKIDEKLAAQRVAEEIAKQNPEAAQFVIDVLVIRIFDKLKAELRSRGYSELSEIPDMVSGIKMEKQTAMKVKITVIAPIDQVLEIDIGPLAGERVSDTAYTTGSVAGGAAPEVRERVLVQPTEEETKTMEAKKAALKKAAAETEKVIAEALAAKTPEKYDEVVKKATKALAIAEDITGDDTIKKFAFGKDGAAKIAEFEKTFKEAEEITETQKTLIDQYKARAVLAEITDERMRTLADSGMDQADLQKIYPLADKRIQQSEYLLKLPYYLKEYSQVSKILAQSFNVDPGKVPQMIQKIAETFYIYRGFGEGVTTGGNPWLSSLLSITNAGQGDEDFIADYNQTLQTLAQLRANPEIAGREGTKATDIVALVDKLERMRAIFKGGQQICEILSKAHLEEPIILSLREQYREQISLMTESDAEKKGNYYSLESLQAGHIENPKEQDLGISLSVDAYQAFAELLGRRGSLTLPSDENEAAGKILRTLYKVYTTEDLIAEGVLQKKTEAGKTQLILTKLPKSLTDAEASDEVKKLIDCLNIEGFEEEIKVPGAVMLDEPARVAEVNRAETLRIKKRLGVSSLYEYQLESAVQTFVDKEVAEKDVLHWSFLDAAAPGTTPTIISEYDEGDYDTSELLRYTGSKAMMDRLLGRQTVTIKENGQEKTLKLWTFTDGVRRYNPEDVVQYLNYLIERGTQRKFNMEKRTDPGALKVDAAAFKFGTAEDFLRKPLTEDQILYLTQGYIFELESGEKRQDMEEENLYEDDLKVSKYPRIAAIQRAAMKKGYPEDKIGQIEFALLYLKAEDMELTGAGLAGVIDLGEGKKLAIHADPSPDGTAGIHFYGQIHENTEGDSVGFTAGASGGLGGAEIDFGLVMTKALPKASDLSFMVGPILSTTGPALYAGIAWNYHAEQDIRETYDAKMDELGFAKIDELQNTTAKVEAIKAHPAFKDVADKMDDADLLAVYESYKREYKIQIMKDTRSPLGPIEMISMGVAAGAYGMTICAAIKLHFGSAYLFVPRIGERQRVAEAVAEGRLSERTLGLLDRMDSTTIKYYNLESDEVIMDRSGRWATLEKDSKKMAELGMLEASKFDKIRTALLEIRINSELVIRNIDGEEKQFIRIGVMDDDSKDIDFVPDPKAGIKVLREGNDVLLSGNLDNLVVTRATYRLGYERTEGGATAMEVVIVSNKDSYGSYEKGKAQHEILRTSPTRLQRLWIDGKPAQWREVPMESSEADYIYEPSEFRTLRQGELTSYEDKVAGKRAAEFTAMLERNRQAAAIFAPTEAPGGEESRETRPDEELIKLLDPIYETLRERLEKGDMFLDDPVQVIEEINKALTAQNQPTLDETEASKAYSYFMNRYFISLWDRGGIEEVKRDYEQHNKRLTKDLQDRFQTIIDTPGKLEQLGITLPAGTDAEKMAGWVYKSLEGSFNRFIEKLEEKLPNYKKLKGAELLKEITRLGLLDDLPSDRLIAIGTTKRSTREGLLPTTKLKDTFKGVEGIGRILGTRYLLNTPEGKALNQLMIEVINPTPNLSGTPEEQLKTFQSEFAIKMFNFIATDIQLGEENYTKLIEFYELVRNNQPEALKALTKGTELNEKFGPVLKAFAEFCADVRTKLTFAEGDAEFVLRDGSVVMIKPGEDSDIPVQIDAYGICGNMMLTTKEEFTIKLQDEVTVPEAYVAEHDETIYTDTEIYQRRIGGTLGLTIDVTTSPSVVKEPEQGRRTPGTGTDKVPQGRRAMRTGGGRRIVDQGKAGKAFKR